MVEAELRAVAVNEGVGDEVFGQFGLVATSFVYRLVIDLAGPRALVDLRVPVGGQRFPGLGVEQTMVW